MIRPEESPVVAARKTSPVRFTPPPGPSHNTPDAAGRVAPKDSAAESRCAIIIRLNHDLFSKDPTPMKTPVRVTVTGPAGQIGYSTLFRIASGAMLGPDQPVELRLLERTNSTSQSALKGVMMELEDCAFPLLHGLMSTTDQKEAFRDTDYALLIGARPRGPGMERADLLEANAQIFNTQGRALDEVAKRSVKVIVVGNPCNTNAWIAMKSAPSLSPKCFSAMLRLDQNRARAQVAKKTGAPVSHIHQVAVWGNHSPTMFPDLSAATVDGRKATDILDAAWIRDEFIPTVAKRGSEIIKARGASSAASAGAAAIDHMRDWALGSAGEWVTMGVPSDGSYGIPEGLVFGFPCVCRNGDYDIVQRLGFDDEAKARIAKTLAELESERDAVKAFLKL